VLLLAAVRTAQQARLSDQLRAAPASRSVIDQALGIVMGQQRCTRERAFDFLRAASQHRNVKLAEVAAELVRIYSGEPPAPVHFTEPEHRPSPNTERRL
jgi:AmiR/NasT family two-component response regulator